MEISGLDGALISDKWNGLGGGDRCPRRTVSNLRKPPTKRPNLREPPTKRARALLRQWPIQTLHNGTNNESSAIDAMNRVHWWGKSGTPETRGPVRVKTENGNAGFLIAGISGFQTPVPVAQPTRADRTLMSRLVKPGQNECKWVSDA